MARRSFDTTESGWSPRKQIRRRATRPRGSERMEVGIGNDAEDLSYRLDVMASSVLDAVESAGGWLYDRRTAGWRVTVLLPGGEEDVRPLRILGVDILPFGPTEISWEQRPHPQGLAIAADLFHRDPRAMQDAFRALEQSRPEVVMWGGDWPYGLIHSDGEIHHELSRAASAFKYHAISAASGHDLASAGGIETFQCGTIASLSPLAEKVPSRRLLRGDQTA